MFSPQNSKLIVVSNRLPFALKRNKNGDLKREYSAGGLVTAIAPVLTVSDGIWIGWPGIELAQDEEIPPAGKDDISPSSMLQSSQIVPVHITEDLFQPYYNGFCNGIIWPLCHMMPEKTNIQEEFWNAYIEVNRTFAKYVAEVIEKCIREDPDKRPIIWVQDYHLMMLPSILCELTKEKHFDYLIAYFHHVPFPPWDLFKVLPWKEVLLNGLLACNQIGFHTRDYCLNVIDCCQKSTDCQTDKESFIIDIGGKKVYVESLPISIPYTRFENLALESKRTSFQITNQKVILGVDRLDYTKGIPQRLEGYEKFLESYPEYIEKVVLIQIALPSRTDVQEYLELKENIESLIGRINGKFSTPSWSAVIYVFRSLPQNQLASLFKEADVCLVTPIRDGMNLVAKEFVACNVGSKKGVLILSELAGAALEMKEALLCNPYHLASITEALKRALAMSNEEKIQRMAALQRREKAHDVHHWIQLFLDSTQKMQKLIQEEKGIKTHKEKMTIQETVIDS